MVDKADEERWLPKLLEDNFEKILRVLCFWENDDKRIGIFIRFLHHSIIYICFIWYIIIHTFMPSYLLFLLFYCIAGLIWLQHIILGGCIFSKIESRLIGDKKSFVDPILDTFHIPITAESTSGIVILGSTLGMFMLSCELMARTINGIRAWFYS
jgi:hypothetical protein